MKNITLKGYKRSEGVYGIRNHIIVLATVCCVNSIVNRIAGLDDAVIPITHQHGCGHIGADKEQVLRTLCGIVNNPNVGGVLLVGLGCESTGVNEIIPRLNTSGKIAKSIIVQEIGKKAYILNKAKKYLAEMKEQVASQKTEEYDISRLVVGLECGGSDPFSGITANPAVGWVSDRLVELGATVILSEVPEMIGAEKVLEKRIKSELTKKRLLAAIDDYIQVSRKHGSDLLGVNPTPGNIKAGLSTIEEKSLGCIEKGGTSAIQEFIDYGEKPESRGLVIMNTPGNDTESVTGMVAGGAHLILFTTGLGTPLGNPVAPVVKISSNSDTYTRMKDFIDIDAGEIIEGASLNDIGERIFNCLVDVCHGKQTASEINGSTEIAINRIGPTF
jgi:altronate dehydratase large subunit